MYTNRYYSSLHHCGRATVKRFLAFSDMWKTIKTFSMKSKHTFTVISWSPRRVGRNGQGTIFNTMNKLCRIVGSKMYFTKMCSFRWKFLRIVSHKTRVWTQTRNICSYVFMCVAVITIRKERTANFPTRMKTRLLWIHRWCAFLVPRSWHEKFQILFYIWWTDCMNATTNPYLQCNYPRSFWRKLLRFIGAKWSDLFIRVHPLSGNDWSKANSVLEAHEDLLFHIVGIKSVPSEMNGCIWKIVTCKGIHY